MSNTITPTVFYRMRGVSLPTISRLLRHGKGSAACTERYIKYLPGALQEAVDKLGSVQIIQGVKIGSLTGYLISPRKSWRAWRELNPRPADSKGGSTQL